MRYLDNGAFYTVQISTAEMRDFAQRWPCSGMRDTRHGMAFQFDKRNGDIVDIHGERKGYDESAVVALSEDAQRFAAPHLRCSNCGGDIPEGHGTHSRTRPVQRFCDACAGIGEALGIGARKPAFLYEGRENGTAVTWTGAVVGTIVRRTMPARFHFAPIRYRVRMLDGSLWYGFGPSANGTYIRLRPMKGA